MGYACHIVHSDASSARNVDALFFMHGWDQDVFHKMCTRTHYVKLAFLHPVGSTGHVVHSGASRVQNIDTIFHARVGRSGFRKKCVGSRCAKLVFLHPVGSAIP
jgi:hypothetical protein